MNRRFLIKASLLLVALNALPAALHAHQQKAAITRVVFNERTGLLEVMHRFYLHDAEHAMRQLLGSDTDIISDAQTQSKFAAYVQQMFQLKSPSGEAWVLSPVGHEIDGNFFWVYQERALPVDRSEGPIELQVTHNALREVWRDQINTVNIERGRSVTTLTFQGSDEHLTALLD